MKANNANIGNTLCNMKFSNFSTYMYLYLSYIFSFLFTLSACKSLSDMMFSTTALFGCQAYKNAQMEACVCVIDGALDKEEL